MNKISRFTPVLLFVVAALILGACNNPHAEKTNAWTGDRTWAQTMADAYQACKDLGMGLVSVSPETGEPSCGGTYSSTVSDVPTYSGETTSAPAVELPAGDQLMSVCDFTTADAKAATSVDVQRIGTEPCGFVWRAVDKATEEAVCPSNMVCTLHLSNDQKVVVKGDGSRYTIVAGTFRIASAYPLDDAVRDVCRLLAKEQAFGATEVPSFTVTAGNFSCN